MEKHTANRATKSAKFLVNRHRGSHQRLDPHARQGVADKRALSPSELRDAANDIRTNTDSNRTVAIVVGAMLGIHPSAVSEIPLIDGPPLSLPKGMAIAFGGSAVAMDLDQVLEPAAFDDRPDYYRAASRITCTPLPQFVADSLAGQRALIGGGGTDTSLATCQVKSRHPIAPGPGVRLRITFARLRNSLGPTLRELGVDAIVAALMLGDWEACLKSNLAYVTVPAKAIQAGAAALYDSLGWGPAASIGWNWPTGSLTTPRPQAVARLFRLLRTEAVQAHAGRNGGWSRLVLHHNLYTRYATGLVHFGGAARATARPDLDFADARPLQWFTPYDDKSANAIQRDRPMLLSGSVTRQIHLYRCHCTALLRRAAQINVTSARRLCAELGRLLHDGADTLFFRIDGKTGHTRPVGSRFIFDGVDERMHLCGDFGRHYFATALFDAKLSESHINLLLRHAAAGVEGLSSTSHLSLADAHAAIQAVVEKEFAALGIQPLAGLSERG